MVRGRGGAREAEGKKYLRKPTISDLPPAGTEASPPPSPAQRVKPPSQETADLLGLFDSDSCDEGSSDEGDGDASFEYFASPSFDGEDGEKRGDDLSRKKLRELIGESA